MHQNKARLFLTEGLPVLESVLLMVKNSIEMKARLLSTKKTKSNISCLFFSFFLVQPNLLLFLFVVLMSDGVYIRFNGRDGREETFHSICTFHGFSVSWMSVC